MAFTSCTHHGKDYSDNDCFNDSFLDYCQQEGDTPKCADSYNFVHDTDTFAPMDIPQDFDDKYYSYIDKNYSEFGTGTLMRKLANKNISNHINEIDNNVTHVNFDAIYSYERRQIMVVNQFDKIFQGILDVDPSCTFPLSCYFLIDWYKDYFPKCTYTQEQIDSIVMTTDPYIDLLTLQDMLRDRLVSSLTSKGLKYWQNLCEFQYAHKEVV